MDNQDWFQQIQANLSNAAAVFKQVAESNARSEATGRRIDEKLENLSDSLRVDSRRLNDLERFARIHEAFAEESELRMMRIEKSTERVAANLERLTDILAKRFGTNGGAH